MNEQKKPNVKTWYHGSEEEIKEPLRSIYLTPSKNLARLHGNVSAFRIDPNAKWLDISKLSWGVPSMDSMGYVEGMDEKFRSKGYDVVWDKPDFARGYQQVYVVNPDVLSMVETIEESNLDSLLLFLEDAGNVDLTELQPRDVVTVYHGTTPKELSRMINGFDARQVYHRVYGGGEHRGVFVAPDLETAKQFGSGAVIEIKTYAKFLHGTDWSGNIGRETVPKGSELEQRWKERYPGSFRPWLSHTLTASGSEPQALLLGVVKPSQITRVWFRKPGENEWKEYTREEFLKQGYKHSGFRSGDRFIEKDYLDVGIDLSSPKLKLEDFIDALVKFEGSYGSPEEQKERILKIFKIIASNRGPEDLEEKLAHMELGGSRLGELARKNLVKQVMNLVGEGTTSESKMSLGKLLHYLDTI